MKILITGGNNAKAMKLLKAFPHHFVLLADYGDVPAIFTENYALTTLGVLNQESTAHILLNFCLTESIDSIIPLKDFEIEAVSKASVLFGEYGIDVLLPNPDLLTEAILQTNIKNTDWAVFVKGECIFSTNSNYNKTGTENLNGVYSFNNLGFNLFTV